MITIIKTILKSASYNINDIPLENKNINQRINVNAKIKKEYGFRVIFTIICDAVRGNIAEELAKTIITFEIEYKIENNNEKLQKRDIAKFIVNELYETKIKDIVNNFYTESNLDTSSLDVDTFE